MTPVDELEARLLGKLAAWPIPIESGCEHDLRDLIRKSARGAAKGRKTLPLVKIVEAEANLEALLAHMTLVAGTLGYTSLHEDTLRKALKDLCPIWPFCTK
jgi:hypothetical protein